MASTFIYIAVTCVLSLPFEYATAFRGCADIIFTHGVQLGGWSIVRMDGWFYSRAGVMMGLGFAMATLTFKILSMWHVRNRKV